MKKSKVFGGMALAASCALFIGALLCGCAASQQNGNGSPSSQVQPAADYNGANLEGVNVASMKGPTSIGLAYLMQNGWGNYTVCASADEVTPLLLQDEVDIACVPANLAATLYQKTGGKIRVLDINTLGVLYVVTGDLSIDSVEKLAGHTIYMTGKGTVPEYTVNAVLEAAGVSPSDVNIEFKSEPTEVAAILNNDSDAIGILPQPYATAVTMKTKNAKQTIDLTEAWESLTGGKEGSLVTGVTVAMADFFDAYTDMTNAFIQGHEESASYANENPDKVAKMVVDLGIIENEQLAQMAIPDCNVVCITGEDMKAKLAAYLEMLYNQNPASVGGSLPGDDFYYIAAAE